MYNEIQDTLRRRHKVSWGGNSGSNLVRVLLLPGVRETLRDVYIMNQASQYVGVVRKPFNGHENCYAHFLLLMLFFSRKQELKTPSYKKRLVGLVQNVSDQYSRATETNSLTMVRAVSEDLN